MTQSGRIAFVCPRFAEGATVGGAETLLRQLAMRVAGSGRAVDFLTTCATDHFTWENNVPPGEKQVDGMTVRYFPVDTDRDLERFLTVQEAISRGADVTDEEERDWIDHNVNSRALIEFLALEENSYDWILMGPYLFGLVWHAARVAPARTLLIPCLHDEPFARLRIMKPMMESVRGFLFNTGTEKDLARRLFRLPERSGTVVGLGIEPFTVDPAAFAKARGMDAPYVLYAGRRETLKGTPLLAGYMDAFRARTGRDLRLVCIGSGRIDAPPSLGDGLVDAGFVSEREKHDAMAGAVAFAHPSVNESLGIVLLESWLAGAPCLVNGHGAVLTEQCRASGGGLWWRTYPEFEEQLTLLLDEPGLRNALADAGRSFVTEHYSWEAVDRRLFAALDAA